MCIFGDRSSCAILCCLEKCCPLTTPLEFQIRQTICETLFVRFSNMARNDREAVNPLVPITVLKLRV